MCGIAGILSRGAAHDDRALDSVQRMIAAVGHRGPDGSGFLAEPGIALGHARLSIIDLATGDQPIHNEDGSVAVVFNGEIFNYVELRADLGARGHRFATTTDTEVLVHLYEEYGLDFVDHLNGQFAVALWDRTRQRLVLARDRVGIRPLLWTRAGDRLLFASEAKSLFASGLVGAALDLSGLAQACSYWAPVAPSTAFRDIRALPPGHLLVVEPGGQTLHRYWDWRFPPSVEADARTFEECSEELAGLLASAVRLQLRADVEVGGYLSGGLDSSAICALALAEQPSGLSTFSLVFADAEFDERAYQSAMIERLGCDHDATEVTAADIAGAFPRAIHAIEAPITRTAPVGLLLLSARVRDRGLKVVLTGEGADEVFAGYDLFKEARIRRFWSQAPQSSARPQLLRRLYGYLGQSPSSQGALSSGFFGKGLSSVEHPSFAHAVRWESTYRASRFFSPEVLDTLGDWDASREAEALVPDDFRTWEPLCRDQYVEAHTLLSGYLLSAQGDRVAMANSVESRYPFLDHHVIEFAARLPARYKLRGLSEKRVLKRAVAPLLPETVLARTKQPYRTPDGASFFSGGRPVDYVEALLSPASLADAGYFNPPAVERLLRKFSGGLARGFGDNVAFVFILSTMLLHEQFVRRRAV